MTKQKSTKRALLMSALALLMCVSMLIGSTFAWFTDSVTSAGNKIVAGTLDVQLLMNADGTAYTDISDSDKAIFGTGSIAQSNNAETLWEPGKTQVAYLAIKNNGTLDLKYTVGLNVENVKNDLYEVMEYDIIENAQYGSVSAWAKAGSPVVVGTQSVSGDVSLKAGETHYFALAIHMDEEAGNEYQGGAVNFDLTVLATQLNSESDSFGSDYDKDATYPLMSNAELDEAIKAGETNITLATGTYIIPDSAKGQNLTISGVGDVTIAVQDDGSYEGCDYSLLGSNVTFENITITLPGGNYRGWASMDATFNNCTINGMMTLYGDTVFNNCTFNISGDAYNIWTWGADKVEFNDCTFNTDGKSILVYNQSCDVYVNGCTFNDSTNGTGFTKSAIETGVDGAGTATYNIYITDTTVNGFAENDVKVGYKNIVGNKNSMTNEYLNIVVDGKDVH